MIVDKTKSILIELGIYSIVFFVSIILFPISHFYSLRIADFFPAIHGYVTPLVITHVFSIYFLMVLFGFLSLKKGFIKTINSIVLVFVIVTFISVSIRLEEAFYLYPVMQISKYWISHIILFVLIIRTFILSNKLSEINLSKRIANICLFVSLILVIGVVGYVIVISSKAKNEAVLVTEREYSERNRDIKEESWNYSGAYNAFVTKYYSIDVLQKKGYTLDSVNFSYSDENATTVKCFTKVAKQGKLDVEAILEENK